MENWDWMSSMKEGMSMRKFRVITSSHIELSLVLARGRCVAAGPSRQHGNLDSLSTTQTRRQVEMLPEYLVAVVTRRGC